MVNIYVYKEKKFIKTGLDKLDIEDPKNTFVPFSYFQEEIPNHILTLFLQSIENPITISLDEEYEPIPVKNSTELESYKIEGEEQLYYIQHDITTFIQTSENMFDNKKNESESEVFSSELYSQINKEEEDDDEEDEISLKLIISIFVFVIILHCLVKYL